MRRLVHCPAAAEELVVLERDFEALPEVRVVDLLVETKDETVVEVFTLLLVDDFTLVVFVEDTVDELDDFTVLIMIEELLELLLVEDTVPPILLDLTLAHTSCVCPISHAPLMLNDSKTMLSIAFKFAPEKELNGTVYV
jgi:hypothetical protein